MILKIVRITEQEKKDFIKEYQAKFPEATDLDAQLESIDNQTLVTLRSIKNNLQWKDIEESFDFVAILKKIETASTDEIEISREEQKLLIAKFKEIFEAGVQGYAIEKFQQIY